VLVREQSIDRDRVEVRIADVVVPIGERRLQRLGDQVEVLHAVVTERLDVVLLQDLQGDRQRRPLRPRPAAVDFIVAVPDLDRRLQPHREVCDVVVGDQAAVLSAEGRQLLRDLALVEDVAAAGGDLA
jgi:hypothetical protein